MVECLPYQTPVHCWWSSMLNMASSSNVGHRGDPDAKPLYHIGFSALCRLPALALSNFPFAKPHSPFVITQTLVLSPHTLS
jgi:hypothetical protein